MKTFEKLLLALLLFGMAACKIVPVEHPLQKMVSTHYK